MEFEDDELRAATMMSPRDYPRFNVLGTRVAGINLETAAETIAGWIEGGSTCRYVCVTDVHCIMQCYRNPQVRMAYDSAEMCVPDGMPLIWVGKLHGTSSIGRVYGPDLMLALLKTAAERGYTNYIYGGAETVADKLAEKMVQRFPGLKVVGTHCPPFRSLTDNEKSDLVAEIDSVEPDLVWVGLGAPKQDLFMNEFCSQLQCKVMIGVGAAFDFHTGRVPQAPRWMMKNGLEWLFRLCVEPRRLGPRYLRNNPMFLWHIFLQLSGVRQYPLTEDPKTKRTTPG